MLTYKTLSTAAVVVILVDNIIFQVVLLVCRDGVWVFILLLDPSIETRKADKSSWNMDEKNSRSENKCEKFWLENT